MERSKLNILFLFFICVSFNLKADSLFVLHLDNSAKTELNKLNSRQFFTEKSLNRKGNLTVADLPIDEKILSQLSKSGARILGKSRWLNQVLVSCSSVQPIKKLPFILTVEPIDANQGGMQTEGFNRNFENAPASVFGSAQNQIGMLRLHRLHELEFMGQNMDVAVIDGGFTGVDTHPFFEKLRNENRIIETRDFIEPTNANVYDFTSHGMQVLSVLAAEAEGVLMGAAPKANYYLFRTENTQINSPLEEFAWLEAIEYADQIGIDIISSSLIYVAFDDAQNNYQLSDLDGRTARISQAAQIAARKGLLVVNAAGNFGDFSNWGLIAPPADADSILAVGAISPLGEYADFSGRGPTIDNRVKPDLVGQGSPVAVASIFGAQVFNGSGTSFSTPLIAGAAACLWQALPAFNAQRIRTELISCASQYQSPDIFLGFGIPDIWCSFQNNFYSNSGSNSFIEKLFPNPTSLHFNLHFYNNESSFYQIEIFDIKGSLIYEKRVNNPQNSFVRERFNTQQIGLNSGVYFLKLSLDNGFDTQKIIVFYH
jgi:serine protease AprX